MLAREGVVNGNGVKTVYPSGLANTKGVCDLSYTGILKSGEMLPYNIEKKDCLTAETEFDEQKDIQLFTDIPQCFYSVGEGQFSILFPEDGHAPMLGEGHVKKCIFKVAL